MSFTLKTLFRFIIRCPHGIVHLMSISAPGGGWEGGYSDIFIHTLASAIFGGSKFRISIFFWFSEEWIFFGGMKNIFLGCLKFLIFFGVNGRCGARALVWRTNQSSPPLLGSPCGVMSTEGSIWMWNRMWILMSWLIKNRCSKKTVETE